MRYLSCLSFMLALGLALPMAHAQTVTIKLGSMVPDGSAWHLLLKQMAEDWSKASDGKVKLKIFPNGVAGNEGDMVRKMRVGQLQAAALTVIGLHDIETSPQAVAAPGLLPDDDEFDAVFAKLQPSWEKRFVEKGFVPIMWGNTGNIFVFSSKEIKAFADMRGLRVFAWAGDPASNKGSELVGMQPVVLSSTDMISSLSTGMIQAFQTTPVLAFTMRWYENAKYMVSSSYGHLPGGTIVQKETWEQIPADLRPKLLEIAHQCGIKVNTEVVKMQLDALEQMKKSGLLLVNFSDADLAAWRAAQEKSWGAVRGGVVSEADFDEVKRLRDEFRASKAKK